MLMNDISHGEISFRPVQSEDAEFLLKVYASTREEELKLVPWDEAQKAAFVRMQFAAQQQHYAQHYPQASNDVILRNGQPVGQLHVARSDAAIHIINIVLLSEYRNLGIGTSILKGLIEEAGKAEKRLRIHVEIFNPALRFYERLGFFKIEEVGFHFLMQWQPGAEAKPRLTGSSD
jgi:ribosomal protein S18 acetylase RimI-like enzyme